MRNSFSHSRRARTHQHQWSRSARFAAMIGGAVALLLGFLIPVSDATQTPEHVAASTIAAHYSDGADEG